ncbi:hypothetical protein B0T14DRAFT_492275 [Immersiella caudata]|uniref:Extracellular membrane protein CFEM domain-containing protein n=1 Tax=Immersiella caudata TaxID=314043 RepID=A0AA39X297_9PEZI|nr:hypothetical protein B0T14DRAFT_492275 [Immersiella caudata]
MYLPLSLVTILALSTTTIAQTLCRNQDPYTNCVSAAVTTTLPCEAYSDKAFATSCKCSTLSKVFDCYTSLCPPDNLNDVFTSQFNSYGCPNAPALKTGGGTTKQVATTATAVTSEKGSELATGPTVTTSSGGAVNTGVGKSGAAMGTRGGMTGGDVLGLVVGGLFGGAVLLGGIL